MNKFLITSFILLIVSGCSNKDLYHTFQTSRMDCLKEEMQQRDACNKKVDSQMSYDQYNKERQKL